MHSVQEITKPPSRWQIEWKICDIAAEQTGIPRAKISPASRIIEDLQMDSLALVEFIMEVEEQFDITIPDQDKAGGVCKQIFARSPFRLRDVADIVIAQWGAGTAPERSRNRTAERAITSHAPFMQLDGHVDERECLRGELYEPLGLTVGNVPQYRRRTDGMRCALIPDAEVWLGSDAPDGEPDEKPMRRVHLSSFLIDAEPVSTTAYARFLNSIGPLPEEVVAEWFLLGDSDHRAAHMPLQRKLRRWRPIKGAERQPMILVSWFGANAYALWANRRDWRAYRGDGVIAPTLQAMRVSAPPPPAERLFSLLPSEAQWEYAARGAAPARYPWGDEPPSGQLACVARHSPGAQYADNLPAAQVNAVQGMSPFGLHHMAGNVWQWCRDWYDPAFNSSTAAQHSNPQNEQATGIRSERGGSWVGPGELARSSYRRGRPPEARGRCLGFRCIG
jgi:acyl carrier protein